MTARKETEPIAIANRICRTEAHPPRSTSFLGVTKKGTLALVHKTEVALK